MKTLIIPAEHYPKRFTHSCGCYRQENSPMATMSVYCKLHAPSVFRLKKSKYKRISKNLLPGDLAKIKRGHYWECTEGHIQPKGRLTCLDCNP